MIENVVVGKPGLVYMCVNTLKIYIYIYIYDHVTFVDQAYQWCYKISQFMSHDKNNGL